MSSVGIRRAKNGEGREIIRIEQKELYPELSFKELKCWANGEGEFSPLPFVALKKEKIVGMLVFSIDEIRETKDGIREIVLELSAIAIKKRYQGEGIGKKLLKEAIEEAKKRWNNFRITGITVETGTDEAPGFYEKVFSSLFLKFEKKVFEKTWSDGEGMVRYHVYL